MPKWASQSLKLTSAGEAMGKQINAGVLVAAKNGGKLYNEALAGCNHHTSLTYYQGQCAINDHFMGWHIATRPDQYHAVG